jgi:hypothetical protein
VFNNPETYLNQFKENLMSEKRSYAGQSFTQMVDKSENVTKFLENGKIVLYKSNDLFKIKDIALKLLAFGLGREGKQIFDSKEFIIENNQILV